MSNTGIVEEGKKFVAYVDGVKVGQAYDYRGAERHLEKALGTYVPRRGRKNGATVAPKMALPQPKVVPINTPKAAVQDMPEAVFVPQKDPVFIPFGEFSDVNTIVASRQFFPVYITGPSGNGKSTMVEQACARNKREFIRIQLNRESDEDQLIGSKSLEDGNIVITEGPVLIAMRRGAVLLIDEADAGDPNRIMCLQGILEGKPFYFKLKNEVIYPAPGFNIFATGNTKGRGNESGKYIGTNMLNEAFLERFPVTFEQEYPNARIELRIVSSAMEKYGCVDEKFAQTLVKWSEAIRKTYEEGALDDLITTRRLIQIVHGYSIFKDQMMAVKLACNRFDSITKATFIEVFSKIQPDDTPVEAEAIPEVTEEKVEQVSE